ncbi:MAG: hypothetical protein ACO36A_08965, partial [Ilumatobacteraceae bacterium]
MSMNGNGPVNGNGRPGASAAEVTKSGAAAQEMRGGRWNTVGVPTEKSENFRDVARRLARLLSAQGPVVPLTLVMAVVSVALVVSG